MNGWELAPNTIHRMAMEIADIEGTYQDAVQYGADEAQNKLVGWLLAVGIPDIGEAEEYFKVPLADWYKLLNHEAKE
jgi:hypothetical protein